MYYVSSRKGNKYGVTDTADGVEELVTLDTLLCYIARNVPILGVTFRTRNSNPEVQVIEPRYQKLITLESGMPVRLQLSKTLSMNQYLFCGLTSTGVRVFDGTVTELTFAFLSRSNVVYDLSDNDPFEVERLIAGLRG